MHTAVIVGASGGIGNALVDNLESQLDWTVIRLTRSGQPSVDISEERSIANATIGGWYSYRASKAALNMLIRNLAIEWRRKNPHSIIVGLHPGTVDTNFE